MLFLGANSFLLEEATSKKTVKWFYARAASLGRYQYILKNYHRNRKWDTIFILIKAPSLINTPSYFSWRKTLLNACKIELRPSKYLIFGPVLDTILSF